MEYQPPHRGRRARQAVSDTIVAAATPPGRGGVAIVRISGAATAQIAQAILGMLPSARLATTAGFRAADGSLIDRGLALYFPAPHSYTGECVLELHGHAGPVVVETLIRRALALGARRAQPGEFTQRAYLNGKLDLAQAEAVADLIDAASESAARAALRSLQGEFSDRVRALNETLGQLRAYVEVAIDFAEEEIDFLSDRSLNQRLGQARGQLDALQAGSRQGRLLTEGMTIVIAGRPNVGKSTLLNRLAGYEAAIVTDIAGTTRDVLREHIQLDGMPLHVLDTAGLRTAADSIEAEGIRRAHAAMAAADRILFVVDAATDPQATAWREQRHQLPAGVPVSMVLNKIDLTSGAMPVLDADAHMPAVIRVSALSGEGVDALREHLKTCMGFEATGSAISARARHVEALGQVALHLAEAERQLGARPAPELVAEELRRAQQALSEIVGEHTSEELLGRIFASFCIGK